MAIVLTTTGLASTAHAASIPEPGPTSSLTPITKAVPDRYEVQTPEGMWSARVSENGDTVIVTSPSGTIQSFDTTTEQFREAREVLESYARDQILDSTGIVPLKTNTPVCKAIFGFIELVNQFGWGLAIAVALSNPVTAALIGAVVGLGQNAFWGWVRSHC